MKTQFTVTAQWDDEAKVFVSESDIEGLHVEAATLEEFEAIIHDVARDLIVANHMSAPDFASRSIKDLIPTILMLRPAARLACA